MAIPQQSSSPKKKLVVYTKPKARKAANTKKAVGVLNKAAGTRVARTTKNRKAADVVVRMGEGKMKNMGLYKDKGKGRVQINASGAKTFGPFMTSWTTAHELGHAAGLPHTKGKAGNMNLMSGKGVVGRNLTKKQVKKVERKLKKK